MTILDKIIGQKRKEVEALKQRVTTKDIEKSSSFSRKTYSFSAYILRSDKTGIIAEFKRKSPSRGIINNEVTVEEITTGYFRGGASALSVLTDRRFFGGSNNDLIRARELNPIPILRKDFVIDEYQLLEARSIGADAILLIAAALDKKKVFELARFASSIDLEVLLEIHKAEELDCANEYVNVIGVNNRDLNSFTVDLECSFSLASEIPPDFVKISESGISSALVIKKLRSSGYQGFLIGENFMRTPEPVSAFYDFVKLII